MKTRFVIVALLMACGAEDSPDDAKDWEALHGTYRIGDHIACYMEIDGNRIHSNNGSGDSLCLTRNVSGQSSIQIERELVGNLTDQRVEGHATETIVRVAGDCTTRTIIDVIAAAEKHRDRDEAKGVFEELSGPWTGRLEVVESRHEVCDDRVPVDMSETYAIVFELELTGTEGRLVYHRTGADEKPQTITVETASAGLYTVLGETIRLLQ